MIQICLRSKTSDQAALPNEFGTVRRAYCGDVAFALFLYLELLGPKVF
jgi:hypothetical protein